MRVPDACSLDPVRPPSLLPFRDEPHASPSGCPPGAGVVRGGRSRSPAKWSNSGSRVCNWRRTAGRRACSCGRASSTARGASTSSRRIRWRTSIATAASQRRHRRLHSRGGLGARARGRLGAGRCDLSDRRVHRPAPRRTRRTSVAGRRLPRPGDPRSRQRLRRGDDHTKIRTGPLGPDGPPMWPRRSPSSARASTQLATTTQSSWA